MTPKDENDLGLALGTGEMVEALGRTWRVGTASLGVQDRFCQWLKLRARRETEAAREDMGEEWYALERREVRDAIHSGAYDWGGRVWQRAIREEGGMLHLLWLMMQRHQPDVTPEQVADVYLSAPEHVGEVYSDVLRVSDPKRFAPAKRRAAGAEGEAGAAAAAA